MTKLEKQSAKEVFSTRCEEHDTTKKECQETTGKKTLLYNISSSRGQGTSPSEGKTGRPTDRSVLSIRSLLPPLKTMWQTFLSAAPRS